MIIKKCFIRYQDRGAICWRDAHIYGKGCCCAFGKCCNRCPSGYRDDGCTCRRDVSSYTKSSYGRGAGEPLKCKDDEEYDAGLCYKKCRSGYKGIGPVCWAGCPSNANYDCGAMCTTNKKECEDKTKALLEGGYNVAVDGVTAYYAPTPDNLKNFAQKNIDLAAELLFDGFKF